MVQETMQAVRDAEVKAEEIVNAAAEKGRLLVEDARKKAEVKKADAMREVKERLVITDQDAKSQGDWYLDKAMADADKAIEELNAKVSEQEASVIQTIMGELI